MIITATDSIVDPTLGTNIGDMTGSGGLAAAFDGVTSATSGSCATSTGTAKYVGKTLSAVKTITRAIGYGSSDLGYVNAANPQITLDLYVKSGSAPSSRTDGTQAGTLTPFADTANESGNPRQVSASTLAQAAHAWLSISHDGASAGMTCAELILFEQWTPPLLDQSYTLDNPIICANSLVTGGNVTTDTEESANPASNMGNPSTSLKWRAGNTATVYIAVSATSDYDYFCVARHNFHEVQATLTLQSRTGSNPYTDVIEDFTVDNDGPLILRFPTQSAGDVRLKIAGATDQPEAAVVTVGAVLILQRRIYVGHEPITMARRTNSVAASSESGEFLGRIILGQDSESEIALENLTASFVRDSLDPWMQDALSNPFFVAWRPDTYPLETAMAWLPPGAFPRPQNSRSNGMMQISIPLLGITT